MSITFITGGVRSGKSAFAERLAKGKDGEVLYVATGVRTDKEMENRIEKHREHRPSAWSTIEESTNLLSTISYCEKYDVVLYDCLSTWVSNQIVFIDEENIRDEKITQKVIDRCNQWLVELSKLDNKHIILVTNETGLGGVAMSSLGRWYQDLLGEINQLCAWEAKEAYMVMSGIPVRLK